MAALGLLFLLLLPTALAQNAPVCPVLTPTKITLSTEAVQNNGPIPATITVYYEEFKLVQGKSLPQLIIHNISGAQVFVIQDEDKANACRAYTDANGVAKITLSPFNGYACRAIRAVYCPNATTAEEVVWCTGLDLGGSVGTCAGSTGTLRLNATLGASQASAQSCPDSASFVNSPFCGLVGLIFGLLLAAAFFQGRNPLHMFDFGSARGLRPSRGGGYIPMTQNVNVNPVAIATALVQTADQFSSGSNKEGETQYKTANGTYTTDKSEAEASFGKDGPPGGKLETRVMPVFLTREREYQKADGKTWTTNKEEAKASYGAAGPPGGEVSHRFTGRFVPTTNSVNPEMDRRNKAGQYDPFIVRGSEMRGLFGTKTDDKGRVLFTEARGFKAMDMQDATARGQTVVGGITSEWGRAAGKFVNDTLGIDKIDIGVVRFLATSGVNLAVKMLPSAAAAALAKKRRGKERMNVLGISMDKDIFIGSLKSEAWKEGIGYVVTCLQNWKELRRLDEKIAAYGIFGIGGSKEAAKIMDAKLKLEDGQEKVADAEKSALSLPDKVKQLQMELVKLKADHAPAEEIRNVEKRLIATLSELRSTLSVADGKIAAIDQRIRQAKTELAGIELREYYSAKAELKKQNPEIVTSPEYMNSDDNRKIQLQKTIDAFENKYGKPAGEEQRNAYFDARGEYFGLVRREKAASEGRGYDGTAMTPKQIEEKKAELQGKMNEYETKFGVPQEIAEYEKKTGKPAEDIVKPYGGEISKEGLESRREELNSIIKSSTKEREDLLSIKSDAFETAETAVKTISAFQEEAARIKASPTATAEEKQRAVELEAGVKTLQGAMTKAYIYASVQSATVAELQKELAQPQTQPARKDELEATLKNLEPYAKLKETVSSSLSLPNLKELDRTYAPTIERVVEIDTQIRQNTAKLETANSSSEMAAISAQIQELNSQKTQAISQVPNADKGTLAQIRACDNIIAANLAEAARASAQSPVGAENTAATAYYVAALDEMKKKDALVARVAAEPEAVGIAALDREIAINREIMVMTSDVDLQGKTMSRITMLEADKFKLEKPAMTPAELQLHNYMEELGSQNQNPFTGERYAPPTGLYAAYENESAKYTNPVREQGGTTERPSTTVERLSTQTEVLTSLQPHIQAGYAAIGLAQAASGTIQPPQAVLDVVVLTPEAQKRADEISSRYNLSLPPNSPENSLVRSQMIELVSNPSNVAGLKGSESMPHAVQESDKMSSSYARATCTISENAVQAAKDLEQYGVQPQDIVVLTPQAQKKVDALLAEGKVEDARAAIFNIDNVVGLKSPAQIPQEAKNNDEAHMVYSVAHSHQSATAAEFTSNNFRELAQMPINPDLVLKYTEQAQQDIDACRADIPYASDADREKIHGRMYNITHNPENIEGVREVGDKPGEIPPHMLQNEAFNSAYGIAKSAYATAQPVEEIRAVPRGLATEFISASYDALRKEGEKPEEYIVLSQDAKEYVEKLRQEQEQPATAQERKDEIETRVKSIVSAPLTINTEASLPSALEKNEEITKSHTAAVKAEAAAQEKLEPQKQQSLSDLEKAQSEYVSESWNASIGKPGPLGGLLSIGNTIADQAIQSKTGNFGYMSDKAWAAYLGPIIGSMGVSPFIYGFTGMTQAAGGQSQYDKMRQAGLIR